MAYVFNPFTGTLDVSGTSSGSGDVTGPASSVDNAIVRFNGTTGKVIQDYTSGAPTVGDTGAVAISNTTTITSSSATALTVGPNGATNPVIKVDGSGASSANGISIKGSSAGNGVTIQTISSTSNDKLILHSVGTGTLDMGVGANTQLTFTNSGFTTSFTPTGWTSSHSGIANSNFLLTAPTNTTGTTANTPLVTFDLLNNFSSSQTRANGTSALQTAFLITQPLRDGGFSAKTNTYDATFAVQGPPTPYASTTITYGASIYAPTYSANPYSQTYTNAYGVLSEEHTGASNNYAIGSVGRTIIYDGTTSADGLLFSSAIGTAADAGIYRSGSAALTVTGVLNATSPVFTTPNIGVATATSISAHTAAGTITLAENSSVALDPAGSADGKYTGITVTATAGYTQAFGDLVYLDPTDSRWEAVDANSAAGADGDARGIIGMVVSAGTDGSACTILLQGIIRADAKFPSFTINNPVYASETAGEVTQTQPTTTDAVIRVIGFAITTDEIYFNPSQDYLTHT